MWAYILDESYFKRRDVVPQGKRENNCVQNYKTKTRVPRSYNETGQILLISIDTSREYR